MTDFGDREFASMRISGVKCHDRLLGSLLYCFPGLVNLWCRGAPILVVSVGCILRVASGLS